MFDPESTTRTNVLQKAEQVISQDRQDEYGSPYDSFKEIAAGWSIILEKDVEPHQVALCMNWLKTVRIKNNKTHTDSWVDMAGYAANGAEVAFLEDSE